MKYIIAVKDLNKISAEEITNNLFNKKIWLFKNNKTNRILKLKINDEILLYKAGINGKYFMGYFRINSSIKFIQKISLNLIEFDYFDSKISIKDAYLFKNKVDVFPIKNDLKFIKNKKNWGSAFLGLPKKINDEDFYKILNLGNS